MTKILVRIYKTHNFIVLYLSKSADDFSKYLIYYLKSINTLEETWRGTTEERILN